MREHGRMIVEYKRESSFVEISFLSGEVVEDVFLDHGIVQLCFSLKWPAIVSTVLPVQKTLSRSGHLQYPPGD